MSIQYRIDPTPARPGLTDLERFILEMVRGRRGQAKALSQADLALHAGIAARTGREVIKNLIEVHGYPICSSYISGHGGYYWPRTQAEVERLLDQLDRHARSIYRRRGRLKRALKHIRDRVEQPMLEAQG